MRRLSGKARNIKRKQEKKPKGSFRAVEPSVSLFHYYRLIIAAKANNQCCEKGYVVKYYNVNAKF